jgi:hypothetical protein
MSTRILAVLLTLSAALCAQDCPDQELERVPQNVHVGPTVNCSSLTYQWKDVRIGQGIVGCPTFVLIQPGYDSFRRSAGAGTWAQPAGQVAITQLTFSCDLTHLLFIPISSVCNPNNERVVGHRTAYTIHPCAHLQLGAAPTVSGE